MNSQTYKNDSHSCVADDVVDDILERYLDETAQSPSIPSGPHMTVPTPDDASKAEARCVNQDQEIAYLRKRLEQVLRERDTARDTVAAMRKVMQDAD